MLLISLGAVLGLALIGFLISSKTEENPTGLLKLDSLSSIVSENPKWYLPFSVLGVLLGFAFNLVIYAFYTLNVTFHYLAIVIKWLYDNIIIVLTSVLYKMLLMFVALWKWIFDKLIIPFVNIVYEIILMILDVLLMILRIAKHYLVLIPIELLLHSIHAAVPALKWTNYTKSLIVVSTGMLAIALFEFIGYMMSMPIIGDIGLYLSMVALVSWVVGLVSFGSHKEGKKAALFSGVLIALTILLLLVTFGVNQLDDMHGWAGGWTGFWYSPSIVSISLAAIIAVSLIFMTSVGAIYANSGIDDLSYKQRISGFAKEAFNRSWTFILQPIFVGMVGAVILAAPYLLLNFSADSLDKVVNHVVSDNGNQLAAQLKKNTVSNKIDGLLSDTTITEAAFVKSLDTLELEKSTLLKQSENEIYRSYFKREIPKIGIGASPVISSQELEKIIKDLNKAINDKLTADKKSSLESSKNLSEMKKDTSLYTKEDIKMYELNIERIEKLNKSEIKSMNEELNFRKSCGFKYGMTLFFFLIGKALIFGLLVTLIVNLFGFTVKPIYEMHSNNYLVSEVKSAQEKNRMQPWIGILLIGLLIGFFSSSIGIGAIKSLKFPDFSNGNGSTENVNVASPNNSQDTLKQTIAVDSTLLEQNDQVEDTDIPDGDDSSEGFTCYDGNVIPMEYVNDGECDCGGCEDEGE